MFLPRAQRVAGVIGLSIVTSATLAAFQSDSAGTLARAAALFTEARAAADRDPFLLLALAQTEIEPFPAAAADDAAQAFELVLQSVIAGEPPARDEASRVGLRRIFKASIEPFAIEIIVQANQYSRAVTLAARSDINCDEVYGSIIRVAPQGDILRFADDCRRRDDTYPYVAIGERANGLPSGPPGRGALTDAMLSAMASENTFKGRSLAIQVLNHAWGCKLMEPESVARGLAAILAGVQSRPAKDAGSRSEAELFGPRALDLMMVASPERATTIASEHPEWEALRRTPGRVSALPVGVGSSATTLGCTYDVVDLYRPGRRSLADNAARTMTPAEFENAVAAAKQLPSGSRVLGRLIALAGGWARK